MWAVGCIFGELLLRAPVFPGNSDIDQLGKVFAVLGTPTDAQWPGMRALPDFVEYVPCAALSLRAVFLNAAEEAISLLQARRREMGPRRRRAPTVSGRCLLDEPRFFASVASLR